MPPGFRMLQGAEVDLLVAAARLLHRVLALGERGRVEDHGVEALARGRRARAARRRRWPRATVDVGDPVARGVALHARDRVRGDVHGQHLVRLRGHLQAEPAVVGEARRARGPRAYSRAMAWFSRWSRKRPVFCPRQRSASKRTPFSVTSTVSGTSPCSRPTWLLEALRACARGDRCARGSPAAGGARRGRPRSPSFIASVACDSVWIDEVLAVAVHDQRRQPVALAVHDAQRLHPRGDRPRARRARPRDGRARKVGESVSPRSSMRSGSRSARRRRRSRGDARLRTDDRTTAPGATPVGAAIVARKIQG